MRPDARRPETGWRRAWRRLCWAAFITVAARSIRITLEAATWHNLLHVSTFLRAGGRLSLERAQYEGTELLLSPDAWFCLSGFAQLVKHGAEIRKTDDGFDILLPSGRVFELPSECLLPSALVVLHERFVVDEYGELRVAGAIVIDVGAHIGDSAVYFADRGAVHVYSFEPFSQPYAAAVRVIRRNLLEHKVTVIPWGVGARNGRGIGFYNPRRSEATRASLKSSTKRSLASFASSHAEEFELVTLPSILGMAGTHYPHRPLVLKMDCEGCEVEGFEAEGVRECLKAFESILLEIHDSDCDQRSAQRSKLEECGFTIALTHEKADMSLLLATRHERWGRD